MGLDWEGVPATRPVNGNRWDELNNNYDMRPAVQQEEHYTGAVQPVMICTRDGKGVQVRPELTPYQTIVYTAVLVTCILVTVTLVGAYYEAYQIMQRMSEIANQFAN